MKLPDWEDPRVQIVYKVLCDPDLNTPPNPEEHWEGWVSRQIVAALQGGHQLRWKRKRVSSLSQKEKP